MALGSAHGPVRLLDQAAHTIRNRVYATSEFVRLPIFRRYLLRTSDARLLVQTIGPIDLGATCLGAILLGAYWLPEGRTRFGGFPCRRRIDSEKRRYDIDEVHGIKGDWLTLDRHKPMLRIRVTFGVAAA